MNALIEALHQDAAEDLWFLDYHYSDENGYKRWCRHPLLNWNQVTHILARFSQRQNSQLLKSKRYSKNKIDWSSIRIQKEKDLDVLVDKDGNEQDKNSDKLGADFIPLISKREYLFGSLYECGVQSLRNGSLQLEDINGSIPSCLLIEQKEVINDLRDCYPDGVNWNEYDADMQASNSMINQ
jgi:hypothetical protein